MSLSRHGREVFIFRGRTFNVALAKEMVAGRTPNARLARADIQRAAEAWLLGPDGDPGLGRVRVNVDYARTHPQPGEPIIAVVVRGAQGDGLFPIDGWHRLMRAWLDDSDNLDVHVLSGDDATLVGHI